MPEQYLGTVIHVGVRMDGPGGISAVMRSLRDSTLGERWRPGLRRVHNEQRSSADCLWQSAFFPARVAVALMRYPGAMVHVHMSTGGSFWRKRMAISLARFARRRVLIHLHGGHFESLGVREAGEASSGFPHPGEQLCGCGPKRLLARAHPCPGSFSQLRGDPQRGPPSGTLRAGGSTPPKVVFLGKFKVEKGIEDVLAAARRIQELGVEASWVLLARETRPTRAVRPARRRALPSSRCPG